MQFELIIFDNSKQRSGLDLKMDCNLSSTFTQDARFNQHACHCNFFTDTWDHKVITVTRELDPMMQYSPKQQTGLWAFRCLWAAWVQPTAVS